MMSRTRQIRLVAASLMFLLATGGIALAQEDTIKLVMVAFDDHGAISAQSSARIQAAFNQITPTDVYIASHGWQTTYSEAEQLYNEVASKLQAVSRRFNLGRPGSRSLVLGVSWPSKVLDNDSHGRSLQADSSSEEMLTLYRAFPREKGGANYESDLLAIQEILAMPEEDVEKPHYDILESMFRKYRITTDSNQSDDDAFFSLSNDARGLFGNRVSPRDAVQLFFYWQMKERAGTVGASGVRQVLDSVLARYPDAKVHLLGHSFGSKLVLSCVGAGASPSRKVDSLILLQGAVSYQAMSPVGGYSHVPGRVRGPVVVTFSEQDSALGAPYELASLLAGQTAERGRIVSRFSALGRVGAEFAVALSMSAPSATDNYQFASGLYNVNGSAFISNHSDIRNEAVARMIWAATQQAGRPVGAGPQVGRQRLDADQVLVAARSASRFVESLPAETSENDLIRLYSDTVESLVARPEADGQAGRELRLPGDQRFSRFFQDEALERATVRSELRQALVDDRFLAVESFRKDLRSWIVEDGAAQATGRILGSPCDQTDLDFRQCVAVGWRLKDSGGDFQWNGTGTLVEGDVVITAAHVVPDRLGSESREFREEKLKEYEFAIKFGPDVASPNGAVIRVKARREHPEFDGEPFLHNDLALLHLERLVPLNELFTTEPPSEFPVVLAESVPWTEQDRKVVILVGYGSCDRDGNSASFGKRRKATNVLVGIPKDEQEATRIGCRLDVEFAAGGQGIDTCNGDSGGPVLFKKGSKFYLVGTTSRPSKVRLQSGVPLLDGGTVQMCGDGGIYMMVPRYYGTFIKTTVAEFHRTPRP